MNFRVFEKKNEGSSPAVRVIVLILFLFAGSGRRAQPWRDVSLSTLPVLRERDACRHASRRGWTGRGRPSSKRFIQHHARGVRVPPSGRRDRDRARGDETRVQTRGQFACVGFRASRTPRGDAGHLRPRRRWYRSSLHGTRVGHS